MERVSIDHCRFEGNKHDGVFVDGASVRIRDSVSSGNTQDGLAVISIGAEASLLEVYESMCTDNGQNGILAAKNGIGLVTARVANSAVTGNFDIGLENLNSATFESLGNNLVRGNGSETFGTITVIAPK